MISNTSTCPNGRPKSTVMVFWDRETKSLTCNLPEPTSSEQIATLEEFKSKLKSLEGTLGDTLDRVFQGAEDPNSTIEVEGSEDDQGSTAVGDYEVLNEKISKLQNEQILHSKQIQKLSEITEERTANGNMLKNRISEIEKKIKAAYELMISPTECNKPTLPKHPTHDQNLTQESGYVTGNREILEQPGSSRDDEIAEAIPFELDWDQGKSENVEIQGKLVSQKAEQGYCLLDKLITVHDVTEINDDVTDSEIVRWTISIRKLEGEVGLGITKWPLVSISDEMSENMTERLWKRDAFGESTIMYYCKTGFIFGGSSSQRTSNIFVRLGDNITFRFDPIQRTLYLQKNEEDPILIQRNIPLGQYYPVATFYKPLDHC